jgi:hypothetical protein
MDKGMKEVKPIKAKAHFYAVCFEGMKQIAMEYGYNLIVHGSMNRDLDLLAVTWNDNPKPQLELVNALSEYLGLPTFTQVDEYSHSIIHGNRDSYVINLNRGCKFNSYSDEEWYIDISFTPYVKKQIKCKGCGHELESDYFPEKKDYCFMCDTSDTIGYVDMNKIN